MLRKMFVLVSFVLIAAFTLSACGPTATTAAPATAAPATAAEIATGTVTAKVPPGTAAPTAMLNEVPAAAVNGPLVATPAALVLTIEVCPPFEKEAPPPEN